MYTQGGSAQQAYQLRRCLISHGIEVEVTNNLTPDLTAYDLVHIHHINSPHSWAFYLNCVRQGKPYCVKAIYHPERFDEPSAVIAEDARVLMFESVKEREVFFARHGQYREKSVVVHPAVDPAVFRDLGQPRDIVHSNGRYEPLKNFSELLRACKSLGLPAVIAGHTPPGSTERKECEAVGHGTLLGEVKHYELAGLYARARVYVCPSRHELHSASVCQAIACGCTVLSSDAHWANGEYAALGYFTYRYGDLKDALAKAWEWKGGQENTTWTPERLAAEYAAAYRLALAP